MDVLFRDLDQVRENVILRKSKCRLPRLFCASHLTFVVCKGIFEELFTVAYISGILRDNLSLEDDVNPRFYVKHLGAHPYTNDGTKWELIRTTELLEPRLRELHAVYRTEPYTLVVLGHQWRRKPDTTCVCGKEHACHK